MYAVNAFDNFPLVLPGTQAVVGVNPFQNEHIPVDFYFPRDLRSEIQVTGIDLTRFQCAPEGSGQSAARRRHHIVNRSRVRGKLARRNFVVFRNSRVDAKDHGPLLGGQVRPADRPHLAFNPHLRSVNNVAGI